jgi:ketosteroid isomerase-like protein
MDKLTDDNVRAIEEIHSSWIQLELAGEHPRLAELCADEIELWVPTAQPVVGRARSPRNWHERA